MSASQPSSGKLDYQDRVKSRSGIFARIKLVDDSPWLQR
jgi:hypothetical protein